MEITKKEAIEILQSSLEEIRRQAALIVALGDTDAAEGYLALKMAYDMAIEALRDPRPTTESTEGDRT